jgi:hypothetical protein
MVFQSLINKAPGFRVRSFLFASAALSVVASACTGSISAGLSPGGNGVGGNGAGVGSQGGNGGVSDIPPAPVSFPTESACTSDSPGPTMLRRLSASQFAASIVDLFGDPSVPVAAVFNDPLVMDFSIDANSLLVQGLNANQLMTNAEAIASWAVTNHLAAVTGCSSSDPACPASFIRSFGKRAFRAPLADATVADYQALFSAEASFNDGVTAVIAAMLQSPRFLYRTELGDPAAPPPAGGAIVALTPYEVASSLSYLLTGSAPDATLLAAADSAAGGGLSVADMVDQQTQRLLADPRSQNMLMDFMGSWLGLEKLHTTVKDDRVYMLTDTLRDEMAMETRGLVVDTFQNGGTFSDLLTADHSFLNKDLAQFYGFDSSALGTTFTRVQYPGGTSRDGGILAHASILTGYARADISSPTQRGHLVRTRLLCQYVNPPGATLDTTFRPDPKPTTTRAHYENAHAHDGCVGCHQRMDPIGYGFEHYDAFGRWRSTENGYPIDSSATIYAANQTDGDVNFNGIAALETYLAGNADLKSCMVRNWAFYAYGSTAWTQDACTYQAIRQASSSGGYVMRDVLNAIIRAPHFTSRVPAP